MGAVWEQQAKTPIEGIFSIAAIQIERFKGRIVATPPVQIWVLAFPSTPEMARETTISGVITCLFSAASANQLPSKR